MCSFRESYRKLQEYLIASIVSSEERLNLGASSVIPITHFYLFPECEPIGAISRWQEVVKIDDFNSEIYS